MKSDQGGHLLEQGLQRALILGLGNPGDEFAGTRHNVGAVAVERIVSMTGIRLRGLTASAVWGRGRYDGAELTLAVPLTYVNESGQAAKSLLTRFSFGPSELLVAHDDLDLRLGELRIRPGGGSGGHRGIQSIINALGTQEFGRLRIGIGRPPGRQEPAVYVLRPFTKRQWLEVDPAISEAAEAALFLVANGFERAMTEYNG